MTQKIPQRPADVPNGSLVCYLGYAFYPHLNVKPLWLRRVMLSLSVWSILSRMVAKTFAPTSRYIYLPRFMSCGNNPPHSSYLKQARRPALRHSQDADTDLGNKDNSCRPTLAIQADFDRHAIDISLEECLS